MDRNEIGHFTWKLLENMTDRFPPDFAWISHTLPHKGRIEIEFTIACPSVDRLQVFFSKIAHFARFTFILSRWGTRKCHMTIPPDIGHVDGKIY